jgi:hypothetical protein
VLEQAQRREAGPSEIQGAGLGWIKKKRMILSKPQRCCTGSTNEEEMALTTNCGEPVRQVKRILQTTERSQ